MGQVLAALGNSRMTGNLYQIVRAIHAGEFDVTAAQQKDLEEALVNVREMRQWLIAALGMKDNSIQPPKTENGLPPVVGDGVSSSPGGEKQ